MILIIVLGFAFDKACKSNKYEKSYLRVYFDILENKTFSV